jgi:single-strand DNA-binding protein
VADHTGTPTRAGTCRPHPTRKEDQTTVRTTTATKQPAAPTSPEEGTVMPDTHVTIVGNLTDDPEVTFTPNGAPVCNFRVAVTARIKDGEGWRDGDTSFYRITAWRQLAERIGDSLAKGHRVIVTGQLRARSWETPEGDKRTVVEVQAEEVGPSLRWATAKPERASNGKPSKGEVNDDPPV